MKMKWFVASLVISMFAGFALGQGTFLYDQQSSDESSILEGGAGIQSNQPMGQSFVPSLSSVGFIRLFLGDATFGNTLNGTLLINLRTESITGPILASTDTVVLAPAFGGPVDFFFSIPVPVTVGTTYYFQPVVQSGNSWGLNQAVYNYSGGTAFFGGMPDPIGRDLWFREGIVVPEPSVATMVLLGGAGVVVYRRRKKCDVIG